MTSNTDHVFRTLPGPEKRIGTAILVSAVLHALMLVSLSVPPFHGNVFARSGYGPLNVRIESLPALPDSTPIAIGGKRVAHYQQPTVVKPVAPSAPASIAPSLFQPGVSVVQTLYLRPLSGPVAATLPTMDAFRQGTELAEKPEWMAVTIPKYPGPAREQRLSGWVTVMLLVDEGGRVVDAVAVESSETFTEFGKEVADDLRGSILSPGKLDGQPVKARMFATVRFDSAALADVDPIKGPSAVAPPQQSFKR
jgi:TonB family protein